MTVFKSQRVSGCLLSARIALLTLARCQHFDLVSERDIAAARSHVSGEVLPHINELLQRASVEMERQERRAVALRNKVRNYTPSLTRTCTDADDQHQAESQQQTLQNIRSIDQHASKLNKHTSAPAPSKDSAQALELEQSLQEERQRLAALKKRKEALLNKADELEKEIQ